MRRTFVRSMRGHAQSESVVPWRGYVLWVGGTLLVLFFAADALMPPPAASRYFSATAKMPTIRIHSELKGPEAVAIDTSGFVPPELRNEQVEASEQNAFSSKAIELQATPPMLEQTEASGSASARRLSQASVKRMRSLHLTPRWRPANRRAAGIRRTQIGRAPGRRSRIEQRRLKLVCRRCATALTPMHEPFWKNKNVKEAVACNHLVSVDRALGSGGPGRPERDDHRRGAG